MHRPDDPQPQSPAGLDSAATMMEGLQRPTWRDHGVGLGMAAVWFAVLLATSSQVGIPRDESFYFQAADNKARWMERMTDPEVESFSAKEIERAFKYNAEHPVLMKLLFGASHLVLHQKLEWISDPVAAYRAPTMLMAALALWLAWLLGLMIQGRVAGLVAALALAFMPRVFFHAHMACFDAPVTFMWLLIAYCFLRACRHRGWGVASGIALGLGFGTKLNIFFLPFALLGVAIVDAWLYKRRTGAWKAPEGERGPIAYHLVTGLSMLFLGALVFFAHWPWLWHETWKRISFYVSFHARHVHYPVDWLGTLYFNPPFPLSFPFLFSLFSIPLGILVLWALGVGPVFRKAREGVIAHVFLLVNLVVPFLIIAMPNTPIFGGTKHWMTAMPFMAVIAGIGVERMGRGLFGEEGFAPKALVLAALMLAPAAWSTFEYGPQGPAYFNVLAGGTQGAAAKRLPTNFWGHSYVGVLPAMNEQVEKRGRVFWHKATGRCISAYKKSGLLRKDLRYTGDWTAPYSNWAVYHTQREKLPEELDIWFAYGDELPVEGYFQDGVQLMSVYHRRRPPSAPPIPPGGR